MIKINLLPEKAKGPKQRIFNQLILGALVVLLAFAGIGWRYVSQKDSIKKVEKSISETDKKIKDLQEAKRKYEELKKKSAVLDKQLNAITQLESGRDWFIRVLNKISESVPRNQVWVHSLKYGGGGRGQSSGNNISLKGSSYDRNAVAHFMGNLSIIPCDDKLPEAEKAEICLKRNERCRRNDEKGKWEWDFEECRQFYKDTYQRAKACDQDVKSCKATRDVKCKSDPKGSACQRAKQKCKDLQKECESYKKDCNKLLEKEFIKYDSISLKYVKSGRQAKESGIMTYDFEMNMNATQPPSGE